MWYNTRVAATCQVKNTNKVRRERKTLKESLVALLQMPMKEGKVNEDEVRSIEGFKGEGVNVSVQQRIVLSMITSAAKGNVKATEWIRQLSFARMALAQSLTARPRRPALIA